MMGVLAEPWFFLEVHPVFGVVISQDRNQSCRYEQRM